MLVSESDQRILSFLAKFRFVPVEIIRAELFAHQRASSVKPYVSRRLKHLRDLGFVQSEYVLGKSQVHSLTPAGAEFMGVEGGPGAGVKLAEYAHDRACIDAYLALLHRGDRPHLITEREARALTADPAENPYAIAITRASGKRGIAWPDIVSGERGSYIGYEVEWSPKNKRRLIHLMHGYAYSENYRIGVYLTMPDSHRVVSEAAEEANTTLEARGMGRPIEVYPLAKILDNETGRES